MRKSSGTVFDGVSLFAAAGLLLGSLALSAPPVQAAMRPSKAITAAVADSARPAADRERDAARKPAACLEFAGVHTGTSVAELFPGKGYFSRIFSRAVGPSGHVYEIGPPPKAGKPAATQAIADDPHYYHNITVLPEPLTNFSVPKPVDLVWTSQNYHDLHNVPGLNVADFDRQVYKALKPGGVFLVLDHAAPAGSGFSDTSTLHRIDPQAAKKEIMSAGFEFVGQSDVLSNPQDPHTNKVFDPSIRGHTDQFIYKFRKPG
ncbi:MAG: class I SAM-dependent methyltransferase [Gammaproteobacteria bacterium]|nr:class I SAM-dependent methyltransferase [Gammaproteobacteria bacterium]